MSATHWMMRGRVWLHAALLATALSLSALVTPAMAQESGQTTITAQMSVEAPAPAHPNGGCFGGGGG